VLFVCQLSVLCGSIACSDSNETSDILCTLLRLTLHRRYLVSQYIDRSAVLQIIRRFLSDLLTLQRGVTGTARMLHALTHSSVSRQVREQM
jgi:hypothetical protein